MSDSLLKSYYKHALVVAYPSLYEGFGLPPLEAMASGAPVMTSNTSSLPEVVGDAALLVNPNDKDQIARSLETIVRDPQLRRDMRAKGAAQVKKFKKSGLIPSYNKETNEDPKISGEAEERIRSALDAYSTDFA